MVFRSVLFPEPLGPTTTVTLDSSAVIETSLSIWSFPYPAEMLSTESKSSTQVSLDHPRVCHDRIRLPHRDDLPVSHCDCLVDVSERYVEPVLYDEKRDSVIVAD